VNINNAQIIMSSGFSLTVSPRMIRTALKRGDATREGAEEAPGPSNVKRARLDADEVPGSAAVPVMEDDSQAKGKGKARQVD
jgi:hypothetical protein